MAKNKKPVNINGEDVDKAVEGIFQEILRPYQRDWILDDSRLKICNKSRQIGMSEAIALEGVLDVLYKKQNVFLVSRSHAQSVELLDKFTKWLDIFSDLGVKLPRPVNNRSELKINGCTVRSLSSNAVTGEGFSGNVYLDEFALHKDDEQIYKSLFPTITAGYNLRIISRPFGQSNMFYKIWTGFNGLYADYKKHQVSIYDAIKQGCEIDLDLLKKNIDEEGFQENYECAFLDESTAYFTYDLLKSCIAEIDKSQEGKKYIGLDVGRTNDATAITVLNQNKDGLLTLIDFKEIKNTRFSDQRPLIQEMIDKYNPVSVNADKGSVGYQLVEDLEGDNKCVKGISMNNQMKMEAFTKMKKSFEEKSLLIPSDIDLLNQIHSVKREFGSGVIRFSADRTAKGHSDMAFSLALAIYATTGKKSSPKITLITGR